MKLIGARVARDAKSSEMLDLTIRGGCISFDAVAGPVSPVIDLSGFLVLPGLINAHDHLEFNLFPNLSRGKYDNAKTWAADIYRPSTSPLREHLALPRESRMMWGGLKNLFSGVTTVAHHNPYEGALFDERFPVNVVKHFGWAHSLDFSPDIIERFRKTPDGWPFILHAAEGTDERARSEIRRLEALGLLSDRTVLVHALGLDYGDLELLRARGTAIVWCPTSNLSIYGRTLGPPVLQSGLNVVLGTDSALTAPVDLIDELEVARRNGSLTAEELFQMVTTRAARVLRLSGGQGAIREGGAADLVVVADQAQSPAEALHRMCPEMVVVRGKVRLVSPRLLHQVADLHARDWHPIRIEGRGEWFTDVNVAELRDNIVGVLGPDFRLAGKQVLA